METTAVKGYIPRNLRRTAFAQFALRDLTFSGWLREHLERWVQDNAEVAPPSEELAGGRR